MENEIVYQYKDDNIFISITIIIWVLSLIFLFKGVIGPIILLPGLVLLVWLIISKRKERSIEPLILNSKGIKYYAWKSYFKTDFLYWQDIESISERNIRGQAILIIKLKNRTPYIKDTSINKGLYSLKMDKLVGGDMSIGTDNIKGKHDEIFHTVIEMNERYGARIDH